MSFDLRCGFDASGSLEQGVAGVDAGAGIMPPYVRFRNKNLISIMYMGHFAATFIVHHPARNMARGWRTRIRDSYTLPRERH